MCHFPKDLMCFLVAAAAAKVASVVSDSVRPHRRQPTRLPLPWDSPGKNTGVGCQLLLHVFGLCIGKEGVVIDL